MALQAWGAYGDPVAGRALPARRHARHGARTAARRAAGAGSARTRSPGSDIRLGNGRSTWPPPRCDAAAGWRPSCGRTALAADDRRAAARRCDGEVGPARRPQGVVQGGRRPRGAARSASTAGTRKGTTRCVVVLPPLTTIPIVCSPGRFLRRRSQTNREPGRRTTGGGRPSPDDVPRSRRCTQGAACERAQARSASRRWRRSISGSGASSCGTRSCRTPRVSSTAIAIRWWPADDMCSRSTSHSRESRYSRSRQKSTIVAPRTSATSRTSSL